MINLVFWQMNKGTKTINGEQRNLFKCSHSLMVGFFSPIKLFCNRERWVLREVGKKKKGFNEKGVQNTPAGIVSRCLEL